uniref:Cathepsin L n=1 Tax=Riptortus pedestris TaxID=329032 RepID=R4WQ79_RIPPE|nr:cathepsin L [Riptortus pedestris]
MKSSIIFIFVGLAVCHALIDDWQGFKTSFGKTYEHPKEELFRRKVYEENLKWIEKHNALFKQGLVSYELKMNKYGDLTEDEFRMAFLSTNMSQLLTADGTPFTMPADVGDIPDSYDWRDLKAVTPVKDQGMCGSCWAFSTIGSLESINFRKTSHLVRLSEQQLVDCSTSKYDNYGCNGGLPERAYQYIKDVGGVDTEESYPYKAADRKCSFDKTKVGAKITGIVKTKKGDENALKAAVATAGPVSVCIDVTNNFRFYSKGVFKDKTCSSSSINHAVLVVGYGTENGEDYWLVKNSWGTSWGDKGYIKMARNRKNQCAIAPFAVYPTV